MPGQINKDMLIGYIIKLYPKAKEIIEKYFWEGCFTCPGINIESLSFGANIHGIDVNKIVNEINSKVKS